MTRRSWDAVIVPALVVSTALSIIPTLIPRIEFDNSVFAAVAERLLQGDRLYVEVWDNKEPLFYYILAAARAGTPLLQVPLEILWVAICCLATLLLAQWSDCRAAVARIVAFVATPLIATGFSYVAGLSELPGVAVALLIVAMVARDRWLSVGLLVAILAFLKFVLLLPVGVLAVVVLVARRSRRGLVIGLLGFVAGFTVLATALWSRGELIGYGQALLANVSYAQGDASSGSVLARAYSCWTDSAGPGGTAFLAASVLLLLLPRTVADRPPLRIVELELMVWSTLVPTTMVLLFTGKWEHHGSYLALPAVMTALLAAHRLSAITWERRRWRLASISTFTILILSGSAPQAYLERLLDAPSNAASLTRISDTTTALAGAGQGGTFARVGTNGALDPHTFGLSQWSLACPAFHQYAFQPDALLRLTIVGLPQGDTIIMSSTAVIGSNNDLGLYPDWERYITGVEALLAESYDCAPVGEERICLRRDPD